MQQGLPETNESDDIKALDTYFEIANLEYDRMHRYFDQIDSKAGMVVAIVAGIPIASLGFAFRLNKGDLDAVVIALGSIGLACFLIAGAQLIRAVWVRTVSFGVPHAELREHSLAYSDRAVREWVANILIESAKNNYEVVQEKTKRLQAVFPFLTLEVLFFLAAIAYLLVGKL